LAAFKELLLTMASHAEESVSHAVRAQLDRDESLAHQALEADVVIDQLEMQIDDHAIQLLSRSPDEFALRLVTSGMKVSQDLERVGDEATTIARRALRLVEEPPLNTPIEIDEMARRVLSMLKDALDAFVDGNTAQARAVIPRDKEVDELNRRFRSVLSGIMAEKPDTIPRCLNKMVICKCLERIGDHAKNIAEYGVFLHEGRDIRHAKNLETGTTISV